MRYWIGFVVGVAIVVAPVTVEGQEETEPESTVAEPSLSPVGIRRWHPDAFEPPPKVEYVSRSDDPNSTLITYRNRVIGSSVVAGIGVALVGGGVAALNAYNADPDPRSWVPVGPITLISLGTVTTLGGLIGAEREFRHRSAGFRTIIFICLVNNELRQ